MIRLIPLLLLAGCAGHEAMQWRPQKPEVRDRVYCETRGADKQCWNLTREEFQRILDQYRL